MTSNAAATQIEIQEYFARYANELRRREEHLLAEVELHRESETRVMQSLLDVIDTERINLISACELVDSALVENAKPQDGDLCRYKTQLVDGVEYLRNFQPDADQLFAKKLRFSPGDDVGKLPLAIANFGELAVLLPTFTGRYLALEQHYLPRPLLRLGLESDSYRAPLRSNLDDVGSSSSTVTRGSKWATSSRIIVDVTFRYKQRAHTMGDDIGPVYRRREPVGLSTLVTAANGDDDETIKTSRVSSNLLRVGGGTESERNSPRSLSPASSTGRVADDFGVGWSSSRRRPASFRESPTATSIVSVTTTTPAVDSPAVSTILNKTADLHSRRLGVSTRSSLVLPQSTVVGMFTPQSTFTHQASCSRNANADSFRVGRLEC